VGIDILYLISSYSSVSAKGNNLKFKDISKTIHLNNLKNFKTWWSYDFGISSPGIVEGYEGQSRSSANKINCFVKFESGNEVVYIYEQIYLSEKFPNNHPYLAGEFIDKSKLFKVWDIDNCLKKLRLGSIETSAIKM